MSTHTILLVDDSPSMRQIIRATLSRAGYQTIEANDGSEALERLQTQPEIALALIDVNMPRLDGIALVRALRSKPETRFIPILMLTTESRKERREEARLAGATGWVMKPFTPDAMLAVVQRLLVC
jgi:two-component system chemotaxis response regulator CheY